MSCLKIGDRIRVDITDETDLDHYMHGEHGRITNIIEDDAGATTGDERDSTIYQVELDNGGTVDLRWRDLRPPLE